jgi:Rrf2 family iron-sulfur cluster assembly transcriptional regulator
LSLLSRKTLYALEAVVDIGHYARPNPVQSKDIAERQGIPQRYLESVMQHLVRSGILRGVRGPRGGYRLARERRRISVGEVIRVVTALESKEDEAAAVQGSDLGKLVVYPRLRDAEERMLRELDEVTIEDLCRLAQTEGVDGSDGPDADFNI